MISLTHSESSQKLKSLLNYSFSFQKWTIDSNVTSASTVTSLILTGVGGFGGIFGIEKFRISPLWWTPIGCLTNLMLCFIGTTIQRRIINQIPEKTKLDKTKKYEIQELLQNKSI